MNEYWLTESDYNYKTWINAIKNQIAIRFFPPEPSFCNSVQIDGIVWRELWSYLHFYSRQELMVLHFILKAFLNSSLELF